MNTIYQNILLKLSSVSPMFAKTLLDSALKKINRTPQTVTAAEMLYILKYEINPKLSSGKKTDNTILAANSAFVITNLKNEIQYLNKSASKILKQLKDEDINKNDFDLFHTQHFCFKIEELTNLKVYEILFNDITYNICAAPIFSDKNIITGTISIITDISLINKLESESLEQTKLLQEEIAQRKEAENQLLQNQEAMVHNSNLASLGEMGASIAHEINNPLAIILTNNKLLLKFLKKNDINLEKVERLLTVSTDAILRISDIIKSMRNLSRNSENLEFQKTQVGTIIEQVLPLFVQKLQQRNINFIYDKDDPLNKTSLECKELELGQVLLNLLNNSFDAITTPTKNISESLWIKIELKQDNSFFYISVSDSGNGIPEELQKKIFTPFFSTKEIGKGTGLGISLSAKILKNHNGELLYDNHSKNTKFDMKLPLTINK